MTYVVVQPTSLNNHAWRIKSMKEHTGSGERKLGVEKDACLYNEIDAFRSTTRSSALGSPSNIEGVLASSLSVKSHWLDSQRPS